MYLGRMYLGWSGGNLLPHRLADFLLMVSTTAAAIGSAPYCW
jgi:hypothetical protein